VQNSGLLGTDFFQRSLARWNERRGYFGDHGGGRGENIRLKEMMDGLLLIGLFYKISKRIFL
jgi:hypothetical protein